MTGVRFLFVAHPAVAHVNPLASLANELAASSHTVAFVGYAQFKGPLSGKVSFHPIPPSEIYSRFLESESSDPVRSTAAAFTSAWQNRIVPLCRAMLADVEAVAVEFKPDVMVVDQHALAGAIVARRLGIPWVTSAPSAALLANAMPAELSQGNVWVNALLSDLQTSLDMEPVEDLDKSPHLVLLYTTREFAGSSVDFPPHYRFVGANVERRQEDTTFPWERLDGSLRRVYVTLGSIIGSRGARFLQTCVEALRDQPLQVIVSDPAAVIGDAPANFIVRPWVPQIELLPKVDLVVTHGGSSVNEALSFGVPLVVAPYHLDNYIYAAKLIESGAGARVRFGRVGPEELRRTVLEVLNNPSYRAAALRIRDSFQAAGGTTAAADEVEALLDKVG